ILSDDNHKVIIDAYERFCDGRLKDIFHINQGIVSGADQVSGLMLRSKLSKKAIRQHGLDKGQPIFVFDKEDQALQALEKNIMRPFYKNSDIGLYRVMPRTERTILYLDGYDADTETKYPKVMAHLEKFRSVLESRREVKTGTRPWYALQWPRRPDVFEGKKIVVP
ncbi:N-6 DNA methylase, partial [Aduncisulcus paluster]